MTETISLRDGTGQAALGAGLAAGLGAFLPVAAWGQAAPLAPDATTLPQVSVEGANTSPPNTNITPTGLSRLPGTVQDVPQTINVVPREILQQQNVTTLEQALRNVPGVTVSTGEGNGGLNGDQFRIRGFQAKNDIFVDGLRDFGVYQRDSFNTDQIQVVKGPTSEVFGVGTVGGAINQVSKRSFLGNSTAIDGSFGSGPLTRGTLDINRQLDETTALRLNAMVNEQSVADRDRVRADRWGVAASLGMGLGTDTQWHLNYFHQSTDRTPDFGVPTIQRPGTLRSVPATELGLPRTTSFVRTTDQDKANADLLTSLMKWQVNDALTLTSDTRFSRYTRDFSSTAAVCATTCITGFLGGGNPFVTYSAGGGLSYASDAWGVENVTAGVAKFTTGPFRHEAVFGVNYFYQEEDRRSLSVVGARPNQLIRTPVFSQSGYFFTRNLTGQRVADSENVGVFAQDRIWLVDQLSIVGGVRYDDFTSVSRASVASGALAGRLGAPVENKDGFVSPKISLILEPTKDQTIYMTYAQSTSPSGQFATSATGVELPSTILPPERSELFELGAKVNLLDGRLGATASLFRVNKSGSFDVDPATGLAVVGALDAGESRRVQGYEFGLTGNITDQWNVQVAYAWLNSRVTASGVPANIGHRVQFVSPDNVSVFTTYDIARDLAIPGKLLIGGGIFYNSAYFAASDNIAKIPGSFSLDSVVSYEIGNVRMALNGYNLTDELNYSSAFSTRAVPSSGRTFVGSLGVRF